MTYEDEQLEIEDRRHLARQTAGQVLADVLKDHPDVFASRRGLVAYHSRLTDLVREARRQGDDGWLPGDAVDALETIASDVLVLVARIG